MLNKVKNILGYSLINALGWHINRKIIVIESDDWGSIRIPSKDIYSYLRKKGYKQEHGLYDKYDSLASNDDLESLFEVLAGFKDINDHPVVITANSVVANPDFEKIKISKFQEYHYEPFYKTFNKYNNHSRAFELWKEGLKNKLFIPQFHGREHINIPMWMRALQSDNQDVHFAFGIGMAGIFPKGQPHQGNKYMAAYSIESPEDLQYHQNSIEEGLDLFEIIWGFKSKSFTAPCYIWSKTMETILNDKKIELIQGSSFQLEPRIGYKHKRIFHFSGEKNSFGQRYNIRNCIFEPISNPNIDWIDACLKQIQTAFNWHKPAVINSHRLNYIGNIDKSNRDNNLKLLKTLLFEIKKKWPDVEFMSSDNLMDLIINKKH